VLPRSADADQDGAELESATRRNRLRIHVLKRAIVAGQMSNEVF
jgi:hypothetical protein